MRIHLRWLSVIITLFIGSLVVSGQPGPNPVTVFQWGANVLKGHGVASGALRVELPTDGTGLVSAAQSGTWVVRPQDASGTAITDSTAHAIKNFPVDPSTGTALVVPSSSNGTVDSGTYRVAIASNNSPVAGLAVGATGSAPPANAILNGGVGSGATGGLLVGITVCDTPKSVSITSGTTTLLITGVSGRHAYICGIHLITGVANNVALLSGTGATCGTGTAGIAGGTTAANGWNFVANGGLALGTGIGWLIRTAATGDSICVVTSSVGPLAGSITYSIY